MSVVALRSLVCTRSTIIYSTTSSANRAIDTALKKRKKKFHVFIFDSRPLLQPEESIYIRSEDSVP